MGLMLRVPDDVEDRFLQFLQTFESDPPSFRGGTGCEEYTVYELKRVAKGTAVISTTEQEL